VVDAPTSTRRGRRVNSRAVPVSDSHAACANERGMRCSVIAAIAVTTALLFSDGALATPCKEISVADLQLMIVPELDEAYCWNHFIETVDRDGLDQMKGQGQTMLTMQAERSHCVDIVTRISRVLRASHKAPPPACDAGKPQPRSPAKKSVRPPH
jgi:hypothetical protein